jgi:hypothetical protein
MDFEVCAAVRVVEPVPTAVAPALVVLFDMVEVTDATTWETVMVMVMVAVEVIVVVGSDCAMARKGRREAARRVGRCIVYADLGCTYWCIGYPRWRWLEGSQQ